jgi:hypothetical protein
MLEANTVVKRLFDVLGNHVAQSVIEGVVEDAERGGRIVTETQKPLHRSEVRVMSRLMEETHELVERLMDKEQVAQRHNNSSIPWDGFQAELDAFPDGTVLGHRSGFVHTAKALELCRRSLGIGSDAA